MLKLFSYALIFMAGLCLLLNEGYWFPWPNLIGAAVMLWFGVFTKDIEGFR